MSEVYVWDDRAQHGMNAAFAFSLLLVLLLLAGLVFDVVTSNLCAATACYCYLLLLSCTETLRRLPH